MMHKITYSNVDSDYFEALPLGNGKFGCMAYYKAHTLHVTLNHYDIYYEAVDKEKTWGTANYWADKAMYQKLPIEQRLAQPYQQTLRPYTTQIDPLYSLKKTPETGRLQIQFSQDIVFHELSLLIEKSMLELIISKDRQQIIIQLLIIESEDTLILHSEENLSELLLGISLTFTQHENSYTTQKLTDSTLLVKKANNDYLFIQTDGSLKKGANNLLVPKQEQQNHLLAFSLFSPMRETFTWQTILMNHLDFWTDWWKTTLSIPDKFLETLWHLYTYLIKASSGIGSLHFKQGPGLNGLWDTKNESLWGSMWYWDVNIQSIFWSTFSSNHLELAKHFCDAYLAHEKDIRSYTKAYYGKDGWAIDYPHHFYNCIQPWCAQFLFWYYEYTNDLDFLRKASLVFNAQCDFILATYTLTEDGLFFPDISPEQGPLTSDSTITIATIRYLFEFTLKTLTILNEETNPIYQQFLEKLPNYAITNEKKPRLMDSPYTKKEQWLRHPSVLMPIFPIKDPQYSLNGTFETIAKNTVDYAFNNCEIGMFGPTWIASAYAQLGEGDKAIKTLYEKGLDFYIHSNGLAYEESERWINLALITKPPIQLPAMMEPTGGLTNTINELLIQKQGNILCLLPGLPIGVKKIPNSIASDIEKGGWKNCAFSNLLVKGGHVISLQVINLRICWLKIIGGSTETIQIRYPAHLILDFKEALPNISLKEGSVVEFGKQVKEPDSINYPLKRESLCKRTLFLGKDETTHFWKKIDAMTRPYLMGNTYIYPMTVYKFDFGGTQEKDYRSLFARQVNLATPVELLVTGYRSIDAEDTICKHQMYGFDQPTVQSIKGKTANILQEDCLVSDKKNIFTVVMPAGKYTLLLGIGGTIASYTEVRVNQEKQTFKLEANQYDYLEFPFVHSGGPLAIQLDTNPSNNPASGSVWAINFLIINKDRLFY
ncbi:hypothetical protein IGI37_002171 [Enterococcus sp. AZ194]|uniref:glycosyl hydrolase family 95 catalytic domain-containing protein n=1 Tax=Enterococcus sp. AZ194 TaxID=2774629 RepID=UPI003F1F2817